MSKQKITSIFLDTNVYESAKFQPIGNNLEKLLNLCKEHGISIWIDDVVYNEVVKRIHFKAKNATNGIKKEQLEFMSLSYNVPHSKEEIIEKVTNTLLSNFQYIERMFLNKIPNEYNQDKLLKMYFDELAPFKIDNKKEEFPDAIMLLSVQKFAKDTNSNILVVSNDNGVQEFCKSNHMESVGYVSHALDKLNEQFKLNKFFANYKGKIKSELEKMINADCFHFNIFGYTYEDVVYAEEYTIDSFNIYEIFLTAENDVSNELEISVECSLIFTATTDIYPDRDTAIHDTEDDVWISYRYLITTFQNQQYLSIDILIEIIDFKTGEFKISLQYDNEIDIEFYPYDFSINNIIEQKYID